MWYFSIEAEERCPNTMKKKELWMQGGKKKNPNPRRLNFLQEKTEVSKRVMLDVCWSSHYIILIWRVSLNSLIFSLLLVEAKRELREICDPTVQDPTPPPSSKYSSKSSHTFLWSWASRATQDLLLYSYTEHCTCVLQVTFGRWNSPQTNP